MRYRFLRCKVGAGLVALVGAVAPVGAAGAPPAGAALIRATRPIIVLESYVGQRPVNAGLIMAPLFDELEVRGFAVRPASVIPRLGGRAPRPGVIDRGKTAAEIMQPAETGYEAYTRGRFAEAERALTRALEQVHRNPALFVLDTGNLTSTFRIFVGLALSQAKRGNTTASAATMAELIRTFPSQPITRTEYGPDAEQFYRAVWRQLQTAGRGQLAVSVESDQAVIFIDGQIRGLGRVVLRNLIPGVYRVFVQVPPTAGRQYEVEVDAGEGTTLHVDWDLDSSLWLTDLWIGLVFETEAWRARQAEFAGKLLRGWADDSLLAVVGTVQLDGRPGVFGSLYDAAGNVVRSAVVTLHGSDELRLRSLARFLAGDPAADDVRVVPAPSTAMAGPAVAAASPSRWAPELLIGAGAAALVTGGILYASDPDPASAGRFYRRTAPSGIAVGSIGAAAVSLGMLWLWVVRGGRRSVPALVLGHAGGFVGWAGEL